MNRIQKLLEGATIKRSAVARDGVGVSGRALREALVAGDATPAALADLAKGRLRDKRSALEAALARLDTLPGIGVRGAQEVVAEIGLDLSRFPTAAHLASWAKVCPGNRGSAGKRKPSGTGHGNRWLRATLVEAAWRAAHTKNSYRAAHYQRIAARRDGKRAALAVAHAILLICYHLLRDAAPYREIGGNYFDERQRLHTLRRAVQRSERLGYKVSRDAA